MDIEIFSNNSFCLPNRMTTNDLSQAYITTLLTEKGSIEEFPTIGTSLKIGGRIMDKSSIYHFEVMESLKSDYPELKAKLVSSNIVQDRLNIFVDINGETIGVTT